MVEDRVKRELARQLCIQAPGGIVATVLCSLILSFILRNVIGRKIIATWLAITLLFATYRYFQITKHRLSSLEKTKNADQWLKSFTTDIFITGLIWGCAGIFLFPAHSIPHQVFIAFVLAGLVAGAAGVFSSYLPVFCAFSIPAVIPITIRFLIMKDEIHLAMGLMDCVFLVLVFVIARQMYITKVELIKLNEEFSDLVKARTAQLERTNVSLQKEIAERKKIEEALKDSEEKYRLLVENAIDTVFIVQDGYIKFHNKRTEELMGYSTEEMATIPFRDHIHPDDRELVMNRYFRRLQGEDPLRMYNFRVVNKSGETMWGQINAVRIKWEGKPAVLCFVRDITEQKKLEEHLQQAQKLESIGLLAGGIAHDFNNILAAILGNISLAKIEVDKNASVYSLLDQAEEASLRASDLTQQLLTFSKGGSPIKRTTSVSEIIKASSGFALRGSKSICEYNLPDDLWLAEVDPGQINQVIYNLILNADQAMPNGGTIRISAENVLVESEDHYPMSTGKYIKISIEDEGVGIPEANLPKIFDPYFTTKRDGTGLGLAITYSIVKRHGGYMSVASEEGKGSMFEIFLPASIHTFSESPKKEIKSPKGSGRILVMDDDRMVRDIVCEMLRRKGFQVDLAASGEEAIKLYEEAISSESPFDAVILDLTVPGAMGGEEAIKHLRKIDPDVVAIVSSGYSNDPIMSNYETYGFRGVLAKPYQIENMTQVLGELLKDKSS